MRLTIVCLIIFGFIVLSCARENQTIHQPNNVQPAHYKTQDVIICQLGVLSSTDRDQKIHEIKRSITASYPLKQYQNGFSENMRRVEFEISRGDLTLQVSYAPYATPRGRTKQQISNREKNGYLKMNLIRSDQGTDKLLYQFVDLRSKFGAWPHNWISIDEFQYEGEYFDHIHFNCNASSGSKDTTGDEPVIIEQ